MGPSLTGSTRYVSFAKSVHLCPGWSGWVELAPLLPSKPDQDTDVGRLSEDENDEDPDAEADADLEGIESETEEELMERLGLRLEQDIAELQKVVIRSISYLLSPLMHQRFLLAGEEQDGSCILMVG